MPDSIDWEVLVVDNNSKDKTPEVVASFSQRYPRRFRYLFEPRPGKSNALNSAIEQSDAEVFAFMDDDVIVEPAWLHELTAPLFTGQWVGSGGRILPEKSFSPPEWLSLYGGFAYGPLVIFDHGPTPGPLTEPPFGTNMAFRREMFEKHGLFRLDLGPRPDSEIRNEDTEFGRRLLTAREPMCYQPSAVVYHDVPEKRLSKEYFLTWWWAKSRADIREMGVPKAISLCGVPLAMVRRLMVWTVRWMLSFKPSNRFECKLKVWGRIAEIQESYLMARNSHKTHDMLSSSPPGVVSVRSKSRSVGQG